jgi:pSer/pThr/pTyr-binding forkhead associated (FHA) protein
MDRQPVLVATKGPLEGARFPVGNDGITIGRDPDCVVILDDPNVSRFHARLVFHNAAIWIQDAGSRNGVFLNEKRVVRHKQFGPGDELVVGDHAFTLELDLLEPEPSLTGSLQLDVESTSTPMRWVWVAAAVIAVCAVVWLAIW